MRFLKWCCLAVTVMMLGVSPLFALSDAQAIKVVEAATTDIQSIARADIPQADKIGRLEKVLSKHIDMPAVARGILGPASRSASKADLAAYTDALRGYLARKYVGQLQAVVGGNIENLSAHDRGKFYEVDASVKPQSGAVTNIIFRVSDRSGRDLVFDIIIEGVSMLSTEAVEIRAIFQRNGNDIKALTSKLKS